MSDSWPIILAGWPLVTLAAILIIGGLIRRRPQWIWIASALALPASLYLAATPYFGYIGLALPVSLVLSGFALRHGSQFVASLLALPYLLVMMWLAALVLGESAVHA